MINKLLKLVMLIIIGAMIFTITSEAFTIQSSLNKVSVKPGEEVIFTIRSDEKIVATNFDVNYDSTVFELVKSNTVGLSVAEKNGKIACIYADMSGVGTDTFEIVLKAKVANKSVSFSLEDAKFRAVNETTSYTGSQIGGIETTVTVKVEENTVTNTVVNEVINVESNNIANEQVNNVVIPNNIIVSNIINDINENKVNTNKIVNTGTNTIDKTTSGETTLPQTGENHTILKLIFLSILLIVVNKIRVDRFKDVK